VAAFRGGRRVGRKKQYEKGIQILKRAIAINPKNGIARHNLAEALRLTRNFKVAIREFRNALRAGYVHESVHYGLAIALLARGRTQKGMDHFIAALRLNPIHEATLRDLSKIGKVFGGIETPESIQDVQKIKIALQKAGNPAIV
jgi:tetratricopeptide (TPR) repeat protein